MPNALPENAGQADPNEKCARHTIVQLTSSSDIGGTERMVLHLAERIDRARFEPIVLSLVGGGALIEACRERGIEAAPLDCRHPLDRRAWRRFCGLVRARRVDLVHLYGLRANLPGRPLARWAGARAVVAGIRNIDPWRRWYHVALDRLTARWVDLFISNSEAGRRAAIERERFDPSRVITIHSGIDERPAADGFDREALRRKFDVDPAARPVVSVIANLFPQKRHRDLIDATGALAERFPGIVFLCAGRDAMNGENQRDAAERGVGERFRWLGYIAEVGEVIAAADFGVLPSAFEGLPAAILETTAMGRTVIATPVGGVPEIVRDGENGLLVPVGDARALAAAIERLATDACLRVRLAARARETVRRDFSIEKMVGEIEQAYLRLLEGRNQGSPLNPNPQRQVRKG